jgi:uncharacterized integral membrane protein
MSREATLFKPPLRHRKLIDKQTMARIWDVLASKRVRLVLLLVFIVNVIIAGVSFTPSDSTFLMDN